MQYRQWQTLLISGLCMALLCGCAAKKQQKAANQKAAQERALQAEIKAKKDQAKRYIGEGGFALSEGNANQALEYFLGAAEIYDSLDEVTVEGAEAHYVAAETAHKLKQRELAIEEYDKAVDIYLRFTGKTKIKGAHALANMGAVYVELRDKDKARDCWERALNIYKAAPPELQNKTNMARIKQNIRDYTR